MIAQGVVAFADGAVAWEHEVLDPGGWPYSFGDGPAQFLYAGGPDGVLVSGTAGPVALLDAGEATFVSGGIVGTATPLFDGAFAEAARITFVGASGPGAFVPGAGSRDVNLIRDVLDPADVVAVRSPFPLLVIVSDGELFDANGTVIDAASGAVTLGPEVRLTNGSGDRATVVIAAVGGVAG